MRRILFVMAMWGCGPATNEPTPKPKHRTIRAPLREGQHCVVDAATNAVVCHELAPSR